ncbi:hypothetical protein [Eubacterium limosum]|uniref:hypothetical protein n=1 Tax=Eubacterium limosum TaxID=1736 RepID=UPI0010639BD8|nr:hypothetical protein [Eubacterium limosum]
MKMSQILFRAKPINSDKYVVGYYVYHINRTLSPFGDSLEEEDEEHYIAQDGFSDWGMPRGIEMIPIDPNTLQYVGTRNNAQECLDRIFNELLDDTTIVDPVNGNQGREILTDRVIKRYKKGRAWR